MRSGEGGGAWTLDIAVQGAARETMAHAAPVVRDAVRAGNWWGGPGIVYAGVVAWLGARALARSAIAAAAFRGVEALAAASAVSAIVKGLAGRARPFLAPGEPWHFEFAHGWTDARYFSMPSGHVTATTAFACGVWMALRSAPAAVRVTIGGPLALSATWVAASRIASDQHWATDTVVGAAIGIVVGAGIAAARRARGSAPYDRIALGAGVTGATQT